MGQAKMIFIIYLLLINVLAFITFGADKSKAKRHVWRIPEKTLFLLALLGGGIGAWLGMYFFHHKTRHTAFVIGIPLITAIEYIGGYLLLLKSSL